MLSQLSAPVALLEDRSIAARLCSCCVANGSRPMLQSSNDITLSMSVLHCDPTNSYFAVRTNISVFSTMPWTCTFYRCTCADNL